MTHKIHQMSPNGTKIFKTFRGRPPVPLHWDGGTPCHTRLWPVQIDLGKCHSRSTGPGGQVLSKASFPHLSPCLIKMRKQCTTEIVTLLFCCQSRKTRSTLLLKVHACEKDTSVNQPPTVPRTILLNPAQYAYRGTVKKVLGAVHANSTFN